MNEYTGWDVFSVNIFLSYYWDVVLFFILIKLYKCFGNTKFKNFIYEIQD